MISVATSGSLAGNHVRSVFLHTLYARTSDAGSWVGTRVVVIDTENGRGVCALRRAVWWLKRLFGFNVWLFFRKKHFCYRELRAIIISAITCSLIGVCVHVCVCERLCVLMFIVCRSKFKACKAHKGKSAFAFEDPSSARVFHKFCNNRNTFPPSFTAKITLKSALV